MAEEPQGVEGTESPILDAPPETATPTEVTPPEAQGMANNLKEVLNKHGIQDPSDVEGLIGELTQFKRGYGQSQNEVGELRRQVEGMAAQLQQNQQKQQYDDTYEDAAPAVPIRGEIKSVLQEFWQEQMQMQQQATNAFRQQKVALEGRPNWKNVKPHFDKAMNDPRIFEAVSQGGMTMEELYSRLNERFLMSTLDTFVKQIPGDGQVGQVTPDVDTSDRVRAATPVDVQRRDAINKAKENLDVDGVLANLIPEKDPILRY